MILSHIQRATRGSVSLANSQPFVRVLGTSAHTFVHNGDIGALAENVERLPPCFMAVGDTDSERAFNLLLERFAPLWQYAQPPSIDSRRTVVEQFAAEMTALGPANFLYADGDAVFAHRDCRCQSDGIIAPPGLWVLHRHCPIDHDALREAGFAIEPGGTEQEITLVASVPLTRESWRPM